jgi:signal transduction histidine kinase
VEDLPDILAAMHRGADRIRAIVSSLKNFSRLDEAELKTVDIHEGIDSTLVMLQHRLEKIEVIKNYGDLPPVNCYARQLNQVFLHLLNNAIDALSGAYKEKNVSQNLDFTPTIRVTTERAGENTVSIRIANNGPGISDAERSRLFDPFFTTKPVGKGTGLSLSICHQIIVQRHGGNIACCSQPGGGTEFAIAIPVRQADDR